MTQWEEWGGQRVALDSPAAQTRPCVYVAWGVDRDRPLYIGKSIGLWSRLGTHMRKARWAKDAVEFEAYAFDSEADALAIEIEAIFELNPIHNTVRRPTRSQMAADRAEFLASRRAARLDRPALPRFKRRRRRPVPPGYPDYFTPEQFEIVRRVQKAGRP